MINKGENVKTNVHRSLIEFNEKDIKQLFMEVL